MNEFNNYANPKVDTKRFKIYADVGTNSDPKWELQGRGVESWTVENNADVNKTTDVLGFVDMERGTAQPTQSGVPVKLRKGSLLAQMIFDAWYTGDYSKLNSLKILQKFEFIDGEEEGTCKARLEEDVMIGVNNFTGEAGNYLGFEIDIHYANKRTLGTMPKEDGAEIVFTPQTTSASLLD